MAIKITDLDKLQRELTDATKALEALEGQITEVRYNPDDPSSVEGAIAQVEAAMDVKIGPYRGSNIVEQPAQNMKAKYREQILDRAAEARMTGDSEMPQEGMESVYRRLNNAVNDASVATYPTYPEAMKKLSRALRSPEIEAITQRLTEGVDIKAWLAEGKGRRSGMGGTTPKWPDDEEKEFGTKIALIELFATDANEAMQSSYVFYHTGTNITSNLNNMTRQLIGPFVRDYIDYLKHQLPAAPPPQPLPAPTTGPAPLRSHPMHMLIAIVASIVCLVLVFGGLRMAYLGLTSDTKLSIGIASVETTSIGVVLAVLGTVGLWFNTRRGFASLERLNK